MSNNDDPVAASQKDDARTLILRCGYASAAVAALPIPGSETFGVVPIHVGMVVGLGSIYDVELSKEKAAQLLARIVPAAGASYVGSRLAMGLGKLVVPVLPGLIGAPLIFANTLAIGAVVRTTFEGGEELADDEVRALYREALAEAREIFDPRQAKSAQARREARAAVEETQDEDPEVLEA